MWFTQMIPLYDSMIYALSIITHSSAHLIHNFKMVRFLIKLISYIYKL